MFTQSAIIENTKEAREWLESIGYTNKKGAGQDYIVTSSPSAIYFIANDNYPSFRIALNKEKAIDCRGDLQLFKAITALRDDSDLHQWFITDNDEWYISIYKEQRTHFCKRVIDGINIGYRSARKATVEELIEHFK